MEYMPTGNLIDTHVTLGPQPPCEAFYPALPIITSLTPDYIRLASQSPRANSHVVPPRFNAVWLNTVLRLRSSPLLPLVQTGDRHHIAL